MQQPHRQSVDRKLLCTTSNTVFETGKITTIKLHITDYKLSVQIVQTTNLYHVLFELRTLAFALSTYAIVSLLIV